MVKKIDPIAWLAGKKHDIARLTGQDIATVRAAHALWSLWGVSDLDGRRAALNALRELYHGDAMQPHLRDMIIKVIPAALDYEHTQRLGPIVTYTYRQPPITKSSGTPNEMIRAAHKDAR